MVLIATGLFGDDPHCQTSSKSGDDPHCHAMTLIVSKLEVTMTLIATLAMVLIATTVLRV